MSVTSVYRTVIEKLQMRKVAARWVPYHLSNEQKVGRKRITEELLQALPNTRRAVSEKDCCHR